MPDHDETVTPEKIEREMVLPAPPEEVWQVVTGSGWLARDVSFELVPGGEASFRSDQWCRTGWVEEAVPPSDADGVPGRLAFWWSTDEEPATRVELTLEPDADDCTRLRVVEARPLELLDVVGIQLPGAGRSSRGPVMLVAA